MGFSPKPGHRLVGRAEDTPPPSPPPRARNTGGGGWSEVHRRLGGNGAQGLSPARLASSSARILSPGGERPGPKTRGQGGGGRTRAQTSVLSRALPQGSLREKTLTRHSWVRPLVAFPSQTHPPTESKCAPTLAQVHCHSFGNSYTNRIHIRAHTQYYKHASTLIHTHKHVHLPSQICVHTP